MSSEIEVKKTERGFKFIEPIETAYRATVGFGESSSAEAPYIWMWVEQLKPRYPGELDQRNGEVSVHMTIEQAVAIRDRLTKMIEFSLENWGLETVEDAIRYTNGAYRGGE